TGRRAQGRVEVARHRSHALRLTLDLVRRLPRILRDVVQLGPRRRDVLPPRIAETAQRGPPEIAAREQRLDVGRLVGHGAALERGAQRPAVETSGDLDARQISSVGTTSKPPATV